jgi:pimeloyl-ACP methyl ester carboxylesterase
MTSASAAPICHSASLAACVLLTSLAGAQTPRISFVTVDSGVSLEVVDWGGSGRPVVLLAGNTQTAHSFDQFAPSLAAFYHVYGITRRGFGASSHPATGYLAERLADDVLAVVDSLRLERPVLAGHSLAGQELSSIGERHPERVAGLVYLDAGYGYAFYDTTHGDYSIDVAELERRLGQLQDAGAIGAVKVMDSLMTTLLQQDLPALRRDLTSMQQTLGSFSPGQRLLPPRKTGVGRALDEGLQRHTAMRAPVLAIFNVTSPPPGVGTDERITKEWLQQNPDVFGRFARGVPQARVVVLPNATHFVFNSNEREVIREMRSFIDSLPPLR